MTNDESINMEMETVSKLLSEARCPAESPLHRAYCQCAVTGLRFPGLSRECPHPIHTVPSVAKRMHCGTGRCGGSGRVANVTLEGLLEIPNIRWNLWRPSWSKSEWICQFENVGQMCFGPTPLAAAARALVVAAGLED